MYVCVCVCMSALYRSHRLTYGAIFLPRYLSILIKRQRQSFCRNSEIWGSYAPFSILGKNIFFQLFETAAADKFKLNICTIRPISPECLFYENMFFASFCMDLILHKLRKTFLKTSISEDRKKWLQHQQQQKPRLSWALIPVPLTW